MLLSFDKTQKLLSQYKIPFIKSRLAKNKLEALRFGELIGYPVVLKIVSSEILHKTDINGVKLNIKNPGELKKSFDEIIKSIKQKAPKAKVEGVLVQKQKEGTEIIIGTKRDPVFGPVIMFGLGGIFVEVFKDVSFRLAPITEKEAKEMIKEIKGYKILAGFRGRKPVNLKKLAEILVNLSKLIQKEKNIKEIDLNPVIVNEIEAMVVDAKILS
jgi:acyl-CoA synthetase (NDP forming)